MKQINSILRTLCLTALLCMTSVNASAYVVYDNTSDLSEIINNISKSETDRILVIDQNISTDYFNVHSGLAIIIKPGVTVTVTSYFHNQSNLNDFGVLDYSNASSQYNYGTIYRVVGGTINVTKSMEGDGTIKNVFLEDITSKKKCVGQKPEPGKSGWKDYWAIGISQDDDVYPWYTYEDEECKIEIADLEAWKKGKGSLTLVKVNGQEPTVMNDGWKDYYELTEGNGTITYYEDEDLTKPISNLEEWKKNEGKIDKPKLFIIGNTTYPTDEDYCYKGDISFTDKDFYQSGNDFTVTGKITYKRTFANLNWQALYVPFAISSSDWGDDFDVAAINNFHEYTNEKGQTIKTELEIRMVKSGKLKPNHPYLIRAKKADNYNPKEINLSTKKMYKSDENSIVCSSVERKYTFTGTYRDITGLKTNDYIFMSGGKLCKATDDGVKLSAQRWYLKITSLGSQVDGGSTSEAKPMEFDIKLLDDESTDIDDITVTRTPLRNSSEAIYNLNGMRVNGNYKGIVIKNGKKYVVK